MHTCFWGSYITVCYYENAIINGIPLVIQPCCDSQRPGRIHVRRTGAHLIDSSYDVTCRGQAYIFRHVLYAEKIVHIAATLPQHVGALLPRSAGGGVCG